jgi:hypothetical protein
MRCWLNGLRLELGDERLTLSDRIWVRAPKAHVHGDGSENGFKSESMLYEKLNLTPLLHLSKTWRMKLAAEHNHGGSALRAHAGF